MLRIVCMALLLLIVSACKVDGDREKNELNIVCSTSIIRDCVQEIAGDSFDVRSLMGPGVDPHSYNPRPSDISLLNNATVVIYNGLHLEGKMAQLFEELGARKTVLAVSSGIPKAALIVTDPRTGVTDPHIWFDTRIWLRGMEQIVGELSKAYPKYRKRFETNFRIYRRKVEEEQIRLKQELTVIPEERRVLITSHDAFHYFSRCFDVRVRALQGISTTQEPGVQDVVNLVDYIVRHKVKALFVEHSVSPKAIRTVIESCRRKGHRVRIGGTLYSDALGDAGSPGSTYLRMLDHNVHTLIKGLK